MLEWIAMVIALSAPYRGPLAEQQVPLPDMNYVGVICPIDPLGRDGERVRRLSARLEERPLAVRTPDVPELGYGLMGYDGQIFVVGFNLLLIDAAQHFESTGVYPPGQDDGSILGYPRALQGGLPNSGENLEWALSALASFGIRDPAYSFADIPDAPRDFRALVADWKAHGDRYDREMVHDLLRRWGLDPRAVRARALGRGGLPSGVDSDPGE